MPESPEQFRAKIYAWLPVFRHHIKKTTKESCEDLIFAPKRDESDPDRWPKDQVLPDSLLNELSVPGRWNARSSQSPRPWRARSVHSTAPNYRSTLQLSIPTIHTPVWSNGPAYEEARRTGSKFGKWALGIYESMIIAARSLNCPHVPAL